MLSIVVAQVRERAGRAKRAMQTFRATLLRATFRINLFVPLLLLWLRRQRDRFMARIHDLERERAVTLRQLTAAKGAGQQLQRDNLTLYEKVRYLQSYGGSGLGGRHLEDGLGGVNGDLEGRYRALYEQQTNPFTQFSQAERLRKYSELSTAEKITLNTTRALLSSKPGRTFAFFYVLGLHLLVFATVLHWSHASACDAAPPLTNHHAPPAPHLHGFVAPLALHATAAAPEAAATAAAAAAAAAATAAKAGGRAVA
jgi:hypothetical protein